jgi:hypothetical protein
MKKISILIKYIDMKQNLYIPIKNYLNMVVFTKINSLALALMLIIFANAGQAQALVSGDTSVCPGEIVTYTFDDCPTTYAAYTFTAFGGTIVGSNVGCGVTVAWNTTPGNFMIQVVGGATPRFQNVRIEGVANMSCDDLVNVSLNGNCTALITPGIVLEGEAYDSYSYVVTTYTLAGTLIPGNVVTYSHLDQTLKVHVRHLCTGITCWGYVHIEDKYIPNLLCDGIADTLNCGNGYTPEELVLNTSFAGLEYPVPASAVVVPSGTPGCYDVTGFDLCCTVKLCYNDEYVRYGCAGNYYARLVRNWTAEDCKTNRTTCSDTIYFRKGTLATIVCPPSYDGVDPDGAGPIAKNPGPIQNCDSFLLVSQIPTLYNNATDPYRSYYHKMANGHPSPFNYYDSFGRLRLKGTGFPQYNSCEHMAQSFRDVRIDVCPGTFKIVRVWQVYDWCSGVIETCTQLIKIEDSKAPVVRCEGDLLLPMTYYTCGGGATVPFPLVIQECSGYTISAGYIIDRNTLEVVRTGVTINNAAKTVTIAPVAADSIWVQFYVTDSCGNGPTVCRTEVVFVDDLDPVAICDEHTVVSLNETGVATLSASSVDNGSYDNCTLDSMFVRRMIDNCNITSNANFGQTVTFCCADVALSPIMVVFRVKDKAGNYNDCMVSVTVQDKIAPTITCPADVTLNCGTDISNLSLTGGSATGTDGCSGVNVTYTQDTVSWNCGSGVINRYWRATDVGGRFAVCTQIITLRDPNPFTCAQVNWIPVNDMVLNGCDPAIADPSITGSKPGYPTGTVCKNIIAGYTDERFYNEGGGICIRIVRKWRVIDWCLYDVNNPSSGICERTQIIRIRNTVAPLISPNSCLSETINTNNTNCTANFTASASATDDCTDTSSLVWTYRVDLGNNLTIDYTGSGRTVSGQFATGPHRIVWEVRDHCGNIATCNKVFTVRDGQAPTPFCKPGLVTVVMPSSREITVKARDFNEYSTDNCTAAGNLRYSFSSSTTDSTRTYRCADLPDGREGRFTLKMYVWDAAGNSSFCDVTLVVQDGAQNICPNSLTGGVSGLIISNGQSPLKNAQVQLVDPTSMIGSIYSEESGVFAFSDIPMGKNYDVMPQKNDDAINGVTTADIVMIQKHILGTAELKTPYERIAADANNSKTITAADISDLRKLILGVNSEFKNNQKSWRFVRKDFEFEDKTNPWSLGGWPELTQVNNLQGQSSNHDFIAIKIGDLNYSAKTNQAVNSTTRNNAKIYFEIEEKNYSADQLVKIPVYGSHIQTLQGFQMGWSINPNCEFVAIEAGSLKITESNYAVKQNIVNVSYDGQITKSDAPLFFIVVNTSNAINAAQIASITNQFIAVEAYDNDMKVLDIQLRERAAKTNLTKFELYQNTPNPFSESTVISYFAPTESQVSLTIKNINGTKVWSRNYSSNPGKNDISLSKNELQINAGVYFYTVESNGFTETKKMIIAR